MNRQTKFLWVVIGILATLALLVMAGGCAKNVTVTATATTTKVVATVTTTMPSPSPSITTSAAPAPAPGGAPPAGGAPPPGGAAASPKPPAPGGAPPPPGGAPPPPGGAPPPPPGGAQPPPPGGAPPPPPGGAPPPASPKPPAPTSGAAPPPPPAASTGGMKLTSTVVKEGGDMPDKYTRQGAKNGITTVSPPVAWTGAPAGTKAFAIVGTSTGNVIFWAQVNIPGTATSLAEDTKDGVVVHKFETPSEGGPGTFPKTLTLYALSDNVPAGTADAGLAAALKPLTLGTAVLNYNITVQ